MVLTKSLVLRLALILNLISFGAQRAAIKNLATKIDAELNRMSVITLIGIFLIFFGIAIESGYWFLESIHVVGV